MLKKSLRTNIKSVMNKDLKTLHDANIPNYMQEYQWMKQATSDDATLSAFVQRRIQGEPLAYITRPSLWERFPSHGKWSWGSSLLLPLPLIQLRRGKGYLRGVGPPDRASCGELFASSASSCGQVDS